MRFPFEILLQFLWHDFPNVTFRSTFASCCLVRPTKLHTTLSRKRTVRKRENWLEKILNRWNQRISVLIVRAWSVRTYGASWLRTILFRQFYVWKRDMFFFNLAFVPNLGTGRWKKNTHICIMGCFRLYPCQKIGTIYNYMEMCEGRMELYLRVSQIVLTNNGAWNSIPGSSRTSRWIYCSCRKVWQPQST